MIAFELGDLHRHTEPADWPSLRDVIAAGQRQ
jgi:hypothetical protein